MKVPANHGDQQSTGMTFHRLTSQTSANCSLNLFCISFLLTFLSLPFAAGSPTTGGKCRLFDEIPDPKTTALFGVETTLPTFVADDDGAAG